METKVFFFCVALAVLILRFTPLDIVVILPGFGLVNTISGLYVIIFSLHMFVKNLGKIKSNTYLVRLIVLELVYSRDQNLSQTAFGSLNFFIPNGSTIIRRCH
jgi:hypothetical protein